MDANAIDDQGTTREDARQMLENLLERYEGEPAALGLVLGKTPAEITAYLGGEMPVEEDLVMKMRGIAEHRDLEIE